MKRVYEVFARYGGKPAGFCGRYHTRDEADRDRHGMHINTIVKRETIDDDDYQQWADSGFRPKGWIQ